MTPHPRSIPVNPAQSRSIPVNPVQSRSPGQSRPIPGNPVRSRSPGQARSIPINPGQSRSVPVSRSIPVNPSQSRSIPVNPDQSRSVMVGGGRRRPRIARRFARQCQRRLCRPCNFRSVIWASAGRDGWRRPAAAKNCAQIRKTVPEAIVQAMQLYKRRLGKCRP